MTFEDYARFPPVSGGIKVNGDRCARPLKDNPGLGKSAQSPHLAGMRHTEKTSLRQCPICRVTMVRSEADWVCLQCGSSIGVAKSDVPEHGAEPAKTSPRRY